MSATSTLVYTSGTGSTTESNLVAMARVAAAGRVQAARLAEERRAARDHQLFLSSGQSFDEVYGDHCHICGRHTNHFGEHTDEQIAEWRERYDAYTARVAS